jgi:hypothetical protein
MKTMSFHTKSVLRGAVLAVWCVVAAGVGAPLAGAQTEPSPQGAAPADSARAIQAACVRRGEGVAVCACGVGLAYARLDPRVFALIPDVEPLLSERDQFKAIAGLVALADAKGLSVSDLQTAYQTIRDNRREVAVVCRPLG